MKTRLHLKIYTLLLFVFFISMRDSMLVYEYIKMNTLRKVVHSTKMLIIAIVQETLIIYPSKT